MLQPKVRKIGNSLGVVLPKEAVNRLRAFESPTLAPLRLEKIKVQELAARSSLRFRIRH